MRTLKNTYRYRFVFFLIGIGLGSIFLLGCSQMSESNMAKDESAAPSDAVYEQKNLEQTMDDDSKTEGGEMAEEVSSEEKKDLDFKLKRGDIAANALSPLATSPLMHDSLSNKELKAFEKKAEQVTRDFLDYLTIVSDTSYDPELRQHTLNQMNEVMTSTTNSDNISGKVGAEQIPMLTTDGKFGNFNGAMTYSGIKWKEKFSPGDHGGYYGSVKTNLKDPTGKHPTQLDLLLRKYPKIVGTDTLQLWQVKITGLLSPVE